MLNLIRNPIPLVSYFSNGIPNTLEWASDFKVPLLFAGISNGSVIVLDISTSKFVDHGKLLDCETLILRKDI
jgi:hypothetical protein